MFFSFLGAISLHNPLRKPYAIRKVWSPRKAPISASGKLDLIGEFFRDRGGGRLQDPRVILGGMHVEGIGFRVSRE